MVSRNAENILIDFEQNHKDLAIFTELTNCFCFKFLALLY